MPCIFCQIIYQEKPAHILYEDELVIAFHDIRPIAPVHVLVVPKLHIESMNFVTLEHENLLGHMFTIARSIAAELGIEQSGYRLMINTGKDGGQSIFHLHLHLIGGRYLPFHFG
jgi:histidine triad (HIT) family protein